MSRELQGAFLGPYLWTGNRQLKDDQDRHTGEGSRSQGKIRSRQQERGKEWGNPNEEGLDMGPRQTVGALQIEDPGMEELSEKNIHRREGSKTPSRAESKSHTPPEPLGLSPFPGRDPSPQKMGRS